MPRTSRPHGWTPRHQKTSYVVYLTSFHHTLNAAPLSESGCKESVFFYFPPNLLQFFFDIKSQQPENLPEDFLEKFQTRETHPSPTYHRLLKNGIQMTESLQVTS